MGRSTFSGPVKSTAGFIAGSDGTTITKILKGTVAIDIASLAAAAEADTEVTIAGAATGDVVIMCPPAAGLTAGMVLGGAWVSAANTVQIRIANASAGTVDEASGTWSYLIIKS
jgi:hypothetical protein